MRGFRRSSSGASAEIESLGRRRIHPARLVIGAFALAILVGTALLMLPAAKADDGGASFLTALFTATSAICVTGLTVVDTATYWSPFGQVLILVLIQVGGFGIMALTSLLALVVVRRLGLRTRLITRLETGVTALSDVRRIIVGVAVLSLAFETVTAATLTIRLAWAYDYGVGNALWHGVFHSVSAFNNAGFSLNSDNLMAFVTDPWVNLTLSGAIIAGGLGFPVWLELIRLPRRPHEWSLHTKLTLVLTGALLSIGTLSVLAFEWSHKTTLGDLDVGHKLLASFFASVTSRTAGFNTFDYAGLEGETTLITDMLMFVGAGSGGTGGGVKVTTFALLGLMVAAELRGDPNVSAFGRRVPAVAQRQALAVFFLALNAVVLATLALMATSDFPLYQSLFEAISAFGTVGLSTGITPELGAAGQTILIALMFLGRTGPTTLGAALVLRERERLYRLPEERPLIG